MSDSPELTAESSFEEEDQATVKLNPPTAAGRYVYVMDTALGAVARIDSESLQVRPIRVGERPTVLRTNPDRNAAVVLNAGDSTVSIITSEADRDDVRTVSVVRHANSLALSRDGRWAAAFYDNRVAERGDPIGSLQEVSLVDLDQARTYRLTAGFAPREVRFTTDGERAVILSRGGLNVVRLAAVAEDTVLPFVAIDEEHPFEFEPQQVALDPTGELALIRRTDERPSLYRVELGSGAVSRVTVDAPPSDVRIVPDGGEALVAVRTAGLLLRIALDAPLDEDSVDTIPVDDVPVGRIELLRDGRGVLLYSTLEDVRRVAQLDLDSGAVRVHPLRKALLAVTATPHPQRALVVHVPEVPANVGSVEERALLEADAVSLLDLVTGYARLILLAHEPDAVVWSADEQHAFLLLPRSSPPSVEWLELGSMRSRTIRFDERPGNIGLVPLTNRIYVTLESEGGRIAFIDPVTGEMATIASYALNAFIE